MANRHPYYDFSKLYSRNGTYNFIVGGRGIGKTYGKKKKVIRDAVNKGYEFIYVRRYKTELAEARKTFIADIHVEFPEWEFKVHDSMLLFAPVLDEASFADPADYKRELKAREWQIAGYFIALSTAQNIKSTVYPKVRTIIFDEFIIEKGAIHYLPNEDIIFNNFYSTVDRYKDKTKVYFLANSVSIQNPYFLAYNIRPDEEREFVTRDFGKAKNFIVCHFVDSEEFNKSVYETNFGQFIKGTEYADYAVGNTFADNHESLIQVKGYRARYMYTLETKTGTFSVWYDVVTDSYFIQRNRPKTELMFTLLPERMDTNKTLMLHNDKPLAYLRAAFNKAQVFFNEPSTRNSFLEIFKR